MPFYFCLDDLFIKKLNQLIEQFSYHDAEIYLLFDNPTSRIELRNSFVNIGRKNIFPDYKAKRVKESKEFYNSLGLIKYYYLLKPKNYKCVQANGLEADDFVMGKAKTFDEEALYFSCILGHARDDLGYSQMKVFLESNKSNLLKIINDPLEVPRENLDEALSFLNLFLPELTERFETTKMPL